MPGIAEVMTANEKCQPNFARWKADLQCNSAEKGKAESQVTTGWWVFRSWHGRLQSAGLKNNTTPSQSISILCGELTACP